MSVCDTDKINFLNNKNSEGYIAGYNRCHITNIKNVELKYPGKRYELCTASCQQQNGKWVVCHWPKNITRYGVNPYVIRCDDYF